MDYYLYNSESLPRYAQIWLSLITAISSRVPPAHPPPHPDHSQPASVSRGSADADTITNQLENLRLDRVRQCWTGSSKFHKPSVCCTDRTSFRTSFRTVYILRITAIAISCLLDSVFGKLVRVQYRPYLTVACFGMRPFSFAWQRFTQFVNFRLRCRAGRFLTIPMRFSQLYVNRSTSLRNTTDSTTSLHS